MILSLLILVLSYFSVPPSFAMIRHEEGLLGLGNIQFDIANRICREADPNLRAVFKDGVCEGCILAV